MWRPLRYLLLVVMLAMLASCSIPESIVSDFELLKETALVPVRLTDTPVVESGSATLSAGEIQPTLVSTKQTGGSPCNLAAAGTPIDISVPDGTTMSVGEYFNKTWRLVNAGSCTWTQEYAIVWFSGETFGAQARQPLEGVVNPGDATEISLDMVAPKKPGLYQGYWKLLSSDGQLFGIGPSGDAPFWVKILVIQKETPTLERTITLTPTAQVVVAGEIALTPKDVLDLDTGDLDPAQGDLSFEITESGEMWLSPKNQASLVFFGLNRPVEWECRTGILSPAPIDLKTLQDGSFLCFRSSQGLPGYLFLSMARLGENILDVKFVTWFIP